MHGITSLAGESYLRRYREIYGVPTLALRCSNVYGPGQPGNRSQGLVAAALESIRGARELPVFGDGGALRDYIHVGDVVAALRRLVGRPAVPPVLNLGSGEGHTVQEVVGLVEDVTGESVAARYLPVRVGDVARIVLDVSLLRSLVLFEPRSLRCGIVETWQALAREGVGQR